LGYLVRSGVADVLLRPIDTEEFIGLLKQCDSAYCAKVKEKQTSLLTGVTSDEQSAMARVSDMLRVVDYEEFDANRYEILITQGDWDAVNLLLNYRPS